MSRRLELSARQIEVLDYIESYIDLYGISPTVREIAEGVDSSSPGPVHWVLSALRDKGFISWMPHKARTIRVLRPSRGRR